MSPIEHFNAFFDLLVAVGWTPYAAARLAAGYGLLTPPSRLERIRVATA